MHAWAAACGPQARRGKAARPPRVLALALWMSSGAGVRPPAMAGRSPFGVTARKLLFRSILVSSAESSAIQCGAAWAETSPLLRCPYDGPALTLRWAATPLRLVPLTLRWAETLPLGFGFPSLWRAVPCVALVRPAWLVPYPGPGALTLLRERETCPFTLGAWSL